MKRERFFTFFMCNRNEKRMNMQKTENVSTELKNNPSLVWLGLQLFTDAVRGAGR